MSVRPAPFTPRRPTASTDAPPSTLRFPTHIRPQTPQQSKQTTPASRKYKASLTTEARTRITASATKPRPLSRPSSPLKNITQSTSRPGTPATPTKRAVDSPMLDNPDFDAEDQLVDAQNVEVDLSADIDEMDLRFLENHGGKDKVLVSVRVRPTEEKEAWDINAGDATLRLKEQYAKTTAAPPEFRYDAVLIGSENKPVYAAAAKSHVYAAMDGFNAVIFAYGQTASGKTFTLTGDDSEPGIIPRAMKDVFSYIRRTPDREYLLRCSYIEIYNEQIHDLLSTYGTGQPVQLQGVGDSVVITPLREEVVTSLKSVKEVLERGWGSRRTATTDWNERSSRSHSVFRLVIESRERATSEDEDRQYSSRPPTPGGSRLRTTGGRSVTTSILSLIDLAGSEKATSDKERTREGRYINTSLLTLGTVIGTLAENATKSEKGKLDHVPFRNSKLTRMLQPSLSGNARISVICTLNPDPSAIAETTSTLLFAQRIKRVKLNAVKTEVVDTNALIERYRKEIEDLKSRLAEREQENTAPQKGRRLSAREQQDETQARSDMNSRIKQLTRLILTSNSVAERGHDESRPTSPSKLDFDLSPYQLQQELLAARRQIESQANQILSLEANLASRPVLPADALPSEKDRMLEEQKLAIEDLRRALSGFESNLGEPLRKVKEDVQAEFRQQVEALEASKKEKDAWAQELIRQLEREKQSRIKLEEEKLALIKFVSDIDSHIGGSLAMTARTSSKLRKPRTSSFMLPSQRQALNLETVGENSPLKLASGQPKMDVRLLDQTLEEEWDTSFDKPADDLMPSAKLHTRTVLGAKENIPP